MNFEALNDDVKFIISKHLASDLKIRTLLLSKNHDLQKILFGEIVFDDDFCKILKLQYTYRGPSVSGPARVTDRGEGRGSDNRKRNGVWGCARIRSDASLSSTPENSPIE
jgi:hypothetical protein